MPGFSAALCCCWNAGRYWPGVLFGLLTDKPHLGLLVPVALIAGGNWRAFITAGIVAMLMAAASWAAFGTVTWQAFVDSIGHTSQAFLSNGWADRYKLQTAFGLTRTLGGPEWLSWTVQAMVAIVAAVCVAVVWRSRTAYEVKASALVTAALLATPYLYLYTYDLVVLAVPLAFLFRLARTDGFLPNDIDGCRSGLRTGRPGRHPRRRGADRRRALLVPARS